MDARGEVFTAAGLGAGAVITGYRQRAEANWLLRQGVPADDIARRLVLAAHLRQMWGAWYVCIYCIFVLGALVWLPVLVLKGVVRLLAHPGPGALAALVPPALGLAAALGLAVLTWWSVARIDRVLTAGLRQRALPSFDTMAEGMVVLPGDAPKRHAYDLLRVLLMVVPHAWCGLLLLLSVLSMVGHFLSS